jgi:hypothetical protein
MGELCNTMYVVQNGLLATCGNIKGKSGVVGEDIILTVGKFRWRRHYSVTALTFVDVHVLESKQLGDIVSGDFPTLRKSLRKRALRILIGRVLVKAAKKTKDDGSLDMLDEEEGLEAQKSAVQACLDQIGGISKEQNRLSGAVDTMSSQVSMILEQQKQMMEVFSSQKNSDLRQKNSVMR